jgi:fatty-acyl-CoA synthase
MPLYAAVTLGRVGVLAPIRPDRAVRTMAAIHRRGAIAGAVVGAALRHGERTALVDDRGALSFGDLHQRSNALANQLLGLGLEPGDGVAILCRNHRGFIDATLGCAKAGLRTIYLNTGFAGPQIADVCEREGARLLIYDAEFAGLVAAAAAGRDSIIAWADEGGTPADEPTLDELISTGDPADPPAPPEPATMVMLTSGTTGTPKGAPRQPTSSSGAVVALFSKVPFRVRETTVIATPMFHALGFAHFTVALALGSTVVTRRRFDPAATLDDIAEHRATAVIVVPAMLQRILELDDEEIARRDTSSLRIIFCGGSQLPGAVASAAMDTFGEVVYNLYGSTEVAWATIGTPEDLRAAPGCCGRPPRGTIVRLFDERGDPIAEPGASGRIFVSNGFQFSGYTDGGTKEVLQGLMSTGDVGHFDSGGRLHIDGRDDEMIVSGGENVFPQEVEELLLGHPQIADAAVIGVADEEFGHRLRAFVVGASAGAPAEDEVRDYVRSNLARYKVPRDVVFVDELPRNATGKLLKRELASRG